MGTCCIRCSGQMVTLLAVVASAVGMAASPLAAHAEDRLESLQVSQLRRTYRLHLPPASDGTEPRPLLLVFHGGFETAADVEDDTGFNRLADRNGFFVVYPVGIRRRWNDGRVANPQAFGMPDDVAFVAQLIQHLRARFAIDPARIYATGMSNGGMFVQRLGCELSDTIAAIAPVDGTMPSRLAPGCAPMRAMSVMEFHGTKDAFVPWHGGTVRALGGKTLSVPDTLARWRMLDGCGEARRGSVMPTQDPTRELRVRREASGPCRDRSEVIGYTIEGGGHTWPGGPENLLLFSGPVTHELSATELIWAFFEQHPKRAPTELAASPDDSSAIHELPEPSRANSLSPAPTPLTMLSGYVLFPFGVLSNVLHTMTIFVPDSLLNGSLPFSL